MDPAAKPKTAKKTGIPMRAMKASAVPQLNPGVDAEVITPMVTSTSMAAPPNE